MSWLTLLGVLGWLWFFGHLDRPHIPAWQARNAYRWLSLVLVIALCYGTHKASTYRTELRFQIQSCH